MTANLVVVICVLLSYVAVLTYAIHAWYRSLAERLNREYVWRRDLSRQLDALYAQLAIEGVAPLPSEHFRTGGQHSGVVVDGAGHERRLLSVRVEDLESRLAALEIPKDASEVKRYRAELVELFALLGRRVDAITEVINMAVKERDAA